MNSFFFLSTRINTELKVGQFAEATADEDINAPVSVAGTVAPTATAAAAAVAAAVAATAASTQLGVTSKGRVAIMTDGEEVGKKITTDAVKEEKIQSREKEENPSSANGAINPIRFARPNRRPANQIEPNGFLQRKRANSTCVWEADVGVRPYFSGDETEAKKPLLDATSKSDDLFRPHLFEAQMNADRPFSGLDIWINAEARPGSVGETTVTRNYDPEGADAPFGEMTDTTNYDPEGADASFGETTDTRNYDPVGADASFGETMDTTNYDPEGADASFGETTDTRNYNPVEADTSFEETMDTRNYDPMGADASFALSFIHAEMTGTRREGEDGTNGGQTPRKVSLRDRDILTRKYDCPEGKEGGVSLIDVDEIDDDDDEGDETSREVQERANEEGERIRENGGIDGETKERDEGNVEAIKENTMPNFINERGDRNGDEAKEADGSLAGTCLYCENRDLCINVNNNNDGRKRSHEPRCYAPPGWRREALTRAPHSCQKQTTTTMTTSSTCDPYGWDENDTFHDVARRSQEILSLEKAHHLHYLLEYRVKQCPLFLIGKCQSHKPFTCFHWHFLNQRRRRPARRPDGSYNYSPYVYCSKYDEKTGICDDGDACTYLHHNLGDTECIYHLRYFKTTPCIHESNEFGLCRRYGRHCAFGHGEEDFRAAIFDIPSPLMAPHLTYGIMTAAEMAAESVAEAVAETAAETAAEMAAETAAESAVETAAILGGEEREGEEVKVLAATGSDSSIKASVNHFLSSLESTQTRPSPFSAPHMASAPSDDALDLDLPDQTAKISDVYAEKNDDDDDDGDDDDDVADVATEEVEAKALTDASRRRVGTEENESFRAWEQALNQARAACVAWKEEAEESRAREEEKEKEKEEEKRKKEMALITCERLSAKLVGLTRFEASPPNATTTSASSLSSPSWPSSSSRRSREFWRLLCEVDEDELLLDGLSLDKLTEMRRILGRCIGNVDEVIKKQNAVLKKIWDGEN